MVRHTGLGVRQHEFHRRAVETGQIEIVLTYLDDTLLDQSVARTPLPLARERGLGVRRQALHFCLAAPLDGIAMPRPCTWQQVEGVDAAVPTEVWRDFGGQFGVGIA